MCGRFSQAARMDQYLLELDFITRALPGSPPQTARYNVAPTTRVPVLRQDEQGLRIDAIRWGWAPSWAMDKRPAPINARVETVATSRFFKGIWPSGRVLVPADGWYEWVKDAQQPKLKQPWFIRLNTGAPLFFAALAQVSQANDGFVIVTDASDQGMLEIHDRRPVVLAPDAARAWLDPHLEAAQAEAMARHESRPVTDFQWYRVGREVGNVRNEGAGLIMPLSTPDSAEGPLV
ncbi:SOS response-associated peptidase [Pseudomonas sp. M47T1]|uniref:SOS response-associated peptidase n=1 Tax=Pseudomonas sp. M47T1 TaxID=1179778 RepID=UPI0005BE6C2C|nr:SOS response-associated peptidase family protein [Pseudomonas sp. M47T1]